MIDKRDLAVLQFIAVVVILFTASWPKIRLFLSHVFPYADVVIPAGGFVLLFHALLFIYTHNLWKWHPNTTYLGGQWIYKTNNAKKIDIDPASLNMHSPSFYGVFEVIHTADKLLVSNGKAWYCEEPPDFNKIEAIWESDVILYRGEKLWIVGSVVANDPTRSPQTQLAVLTVIRKESQIEMTGTIYGVADPDGEYAYGFTEMRKISNRSWGDAAQKAYRIFGSS